MTQFKRWLIWLSRIHHCRGFGIQSPTDYAFVRYVVNEHWPYYAYEELVDNYWMTQKLGRLYFRLSNWRQPKQMLPDSYLRYWKAGCNTTVFTDNLQTVELARLDVEDMTSWENLLPKCNNASVVVVEGIWRNKEAWMSMVNNAKVVISFDLYYCGIVFFDKNRYPKHYIINY